MCWERDAQRYMGRFIQTIWVSVNAVAAGDRAIRVCVTAKSLRTRARVLAGAMRMCSRTHAGALVQMIRPTASTREARMVRTSSFRASSAAPRQKAGWRRGVGRHRLTVAVGDVPSKRPASGGSTLLSTVTRRSLCRI